MIICPCCKSENEETAKFCSQCGNALTVSKHVTTSEISNNIEENINEEVLCNDQESFDIPKKNG